ncbi:electron transport complex subunit RsxC [Halosquirtibacter laminarini]|uniref:Electron transport complex subunit RsxC n=1 Tax=Halosquirtibacter laminarini TaxID=3374600 RepID=A0AC61NK26_9BACT|nr:electron transport complex subunit RsxC [Prolixibacteraceae bacterium]
MLKTFKIGGIHPAENKLSANAKIHTLPIPKTVYIPMGQHIGAPATPLVKKGDMVKVGQMIGKASGFVSANIHSSVSGKVKKIDQIIDSSGYKKDVVVIDVDGDEWEESIDRSTELVKEITLTQEEIKAKIAESGIVGLGGATFPTHIKLSPPPGNTAKVLVINAVECEPYLTADHQIMLEKGEEIMVGVSILMKGVGVEKAIIGIENNKKDAIDYFKKIAKAYKGIEIAPLKVQYPQGGEKQLIAATIGKEVPSGALPIAVGAVVNNVATAYAVYEAIQKNKPLFERIVTVTGKSVKNPCNLLVRGGTPTNDLIDFAGGLPEDTGKVISGGPMMGKALVNLEVPAAKGTSGILIMQDTESARAKMDACIRCAKCVKACPMGIEPYLLMSLAEKSNWDQSEQRNVMDCIECGSCSFTCPSNRPLLDYIRMGKGKVGQIIRGRKS